MHASSSHTALMPPNSPLQQHVLVAFASDFIMDDQLAGLLKAEELYNHCVQLVRRLSALKIAKEEYLILKAILLANAGM